MNHLIGGPWPTREQELLLKAALFEDHECRSAWQEWTSLINIEDLDDGSHRLLPLAYHNLHRQGVEDPLLQRLRSVYRFMLAKNQLMFHGVMPLVQKLEKSGIDTMLLKGSALTLTHYRNYALRPQLDIDVAVRAECAREAYMILDQAGWRTEYPYPVDRVLKFRHSCGFEAGAHKRLDLHWNIFQECRGKGIDDEFWKRAVEITAAGIRTRSLCATDQLFHSCIHGVKWNSLSPCRWVADATTIIKHSYKEVNWDRMARMAETRGLIIPLTNAFSYLQEKFGIEVPFSCEKIFSQAKPTALQKLEYRIAINKKALFGNLFKFSVMYLRIPQSSFWEALVQYPLFLQLMWRIKYLWTMPFALAYEMLKMAFHQNESPHPHRRNNHGAQNRLPSEHPYGD